jgi:site-specific recombinase XerC
VTFGAFFTTVLRLLMTQLTPCVDIARNLRAVQLLLGHTKMDSTVRYLGVELEDALAISEAIEI